MSSSEQEIIVDIEGIIPQEDKADWRVGVTDNPDGLWRSLGSPDSWRCWYTETASRAKWVHSYLSDKKFHVLKLDGEIPAYVYIHRVHQNVTA